MKDIKIKVVNYLKDFRKKYEAENSRWFFLVPTIFITIDNDGASISIAWLCFGIALLKER